MDITPVIFQDQYASYFDYFLVTIFVKGMSIIVNVEFLLVLSTVFTEALEEAPSQDSEADTEILAEARMVSTDLASSSTAPPTTANHDPILEVTIQVEEPEIFLLADAKQKNTNTLIVKVRSVYSINTLER